MSRFAPRPQPPYYAVIFTSQRRDAPVEADAQAGAEADEADYSDAAERMAALAAQQPGYLGVESTRDASGLGITVSYWRTLDDIAAWRGHLEHTAARTAGRAQWYSHYELRIARVERAYGWDRADGTRPGDSGR